MTINATGAGAGRDVRRRRRAAGRPAASVRGTVQNDVLKEYVARGTYIYPPRPSPASRRRPDRVVHGNAPKFNPISLSGYHIREAGPTAVQEMAFAIANAIAYVEAVLARGVGVDDFAPKLSWIFNTHIDFFEEIAKYRALRRMWATVDARALRRARPASLQLRTHTQTGGSTLTAQQPENNIVRAAIEALAAVLGGVQSLALSCYDEASRSRPRKRRRSRCARSRSSPRRSASPTPPIRSAAPTTSSG